MPTKIHWTDETWNPVTGCSKISTGCQHCYAERMAKRLAGRFGYPADEPFRVTFHPLRLQEPYRWRKPRRVFVCSMGDLFHDDVDPDWIDAVWQIMGTLPQHTFQVLTKRPANMRKWFESTPADTDLPNVWIGTTTENREAYRERVSILLSIPAAVRFVSVEPMLQPIDAGFVHYLDWVIVGCESGHRRRRCSIEWVRDLVKQCKQAGVATFVKQLDIDGRVERDVEKFPADLQIREYPRKAKPCQDKPGEPLKSKRKSN